MNQKKNKTPPQKKEIKKKIRRRNDGDETARKLRMYFNSDTQAAIVAWQKAEERKEKEKLYVEVISPAFEKLVENLINIHKFTSLHDSFEDLKNDCVNFLFETIIKFDATRGTNAFSYFNVVAKNWLINRTKQRILRTKRNISLDDDLSMTSADQKRIEEYNTVQSPLDTVDPKTQNIRILQILLEMKTRAKNEQETAAISAISTIFENVEDIDILNKTSILVYMRELSGLNPKQLTMVMQNIRKYYKKLKSDPKFD